MYDIQAVEKGKMTKEAAEKEGKAVEGRIQYTLKLEDLKDVDLVIEVNLLARRPLRVQS